jgi:uncharacterized protein involved in exopolysaccharide biosynthesis
VVETESPELSQQMVRKAVKSLDEFVLSKSRTKGGNKAIFTSQRLQEARASSLQAESEFREFINTNRNYSTSSDPKVRLQGQRLENELKLRQQILTTLSLNHEQALLEEKNDMPIINVLDEGDLPLEKSGPARTLFVLAAAILSGLSTWLWQHRTSIRQRLFPEEPVQG